MLKRVYASGVMPNHFIYDSNCLLKKHVEGGPAFANVAMTVDVFHFKTKHFEGDIYCQKNCNPSAYPELLGEGDKPWFFNSSVAEQTNAWCGKFYAVCHEMGSEKYEFFLDEMIIMRNAATVKRLARKESQPTYWS